MVSLSYQLLASYVKDFNALSRKEHQFRRNNEKKITSRIKGQKLTTNVFLAKKAYLNSGVKI